MTTATVRAERFVSSRPQAASASLRSATIAFWLVGCTSPGLSRDHAQRVVNAVERRRPRRAARNHEHFGRQALGDPTVADELCCPVRFRSDVPGCIRQHRCRPSGTAGTGPATMRRRRLSPQIGIRGRSTSRALRDMLNPLALRVWEPGPRSALCLRGLTPARHRYYSRTLS